MGGGRIDGRVMQLASFQVLHERWWQGEGGVLKERKDVTRLTSGQRQTRGSEMKTMRTWKEAKRPEEGIARWRVRPGEA